MGLTDCIKRACGRAGTLALSPQMPISNGRNAVAHAATWLSAVSACAACGLLSFLPHYLTLLSLFCADWRWLPLACSRSGGVCEKGHKPSSGLGLVLTTPHTQLQAGETCLTGWFGMRLLALAACLTAICRLLHVLRPHAELLAEGMRRSFAAACALSVGCSQGQKGMPTNANASVDY